jgi:tetratricopeptide (TPR) repeat protein
MTDEVQENNLSHINEMRLQSEALQKIAAHYAQPENESRLKRLQSIIIKAGTISAIVIGGVLGGGEALIYLWEQQNIRTMADDYASVGKEIYYRENNGEVALTFIDKAINLQPKNSEYRYDKAYIEGMAVVRTLLNLDRDYTAKELNQTHNALAKAILLERQAPEKPDSHILRGQIYSALRDYKRAKEAIQKALVLDPKNSFALVRMAVVDYNSKRIEAARSNLNSAIDANPNFKWAYLWHGIISSDNGKIVEARKWFNKALKVDPRFGLAFYNRGWSYLKSGDRDYVQAEKNFRSALRYNPDYKEAWYGLGFVYGSQNRYEIALQYLNRAVGIDNQFLTGWKWRGIINDELGRYKEALKDFSKAIALHPANADLYVRRARVSIKSKSFQTALKDLFRAMKINPKNSRIQYYTGNVYAALEQNNEAIESYGKAIKLKSNYSEAFAARAEVFEKQGNATRARSDLDTAVVSAKYRRERFYFKRAEFNERHGENNTAVVDYKDARKINPRFAKAWLGEARVLNKLGHGELAYKSVVEYVKLRPTDMVGTTLRNQLKNKKLK